MRLKHFSLSFGLQLHKALADEARIRVLNLLAHQPEMCISDLELTLSFTQTKTARHVTYLKNAGLLSMRRFDAFVFYRLKEEFAELVRQQIRFMEKDSVLRNDLEVYRILHSNRELAVNRLYTRGYKP